MNMNRFAPYVAPILRLAVGGVFLHHGIAKLQRGVPGVAAFLHDVGFPFAPFWAVIVITVETVGAACVIAGILTRVWAACMAVEMVVAILAVRLPRAASFELEALLFAAAIALVALGDGPLSIAVRFKKPQ